MYCGSNPTALLSQQQLAEAMFRLLGEKPFAAISVSELCRTAGVSRQTFYSLFESKESVVAYALTERCCYSPEREQGNGVGSLRQMCAEYSRYLHSHAEFLRTLAENDIIYLLYDSLRDSFLDCGCFLSERSQEARAYAADFMAGGFTSIARTFLRTGGMTDPAVLGELAYKLFCGELLDF